MGFGEEALSSVGFDGQTSVRGESRSDESRARRWKMERAGREEGCFGICERKHMHTGTSISHTIQTQADRLDNQFLDPALAWHYVALTSPSKHA